MGKTSNLFLFLVMIITVANAQKEPAAGGSTAKAAPGGGVIELTKFGPLGADVAPNVISAWKEACESPNPSKIVIPKGDHDLTAILLQGPCKSPVTIEIAGNLKAPAELPPDAKAWIEIENMDGLTFQGMPGGGAFDGEGEPAWKNNICHKTFKCSLPYSFRFTGLKEAVIKGITSLDAKQFHMNIENCIGVTLEDMKVLAPGDSPNTDGIHIVNSENVKILGAEIRTGDDCVSVGSGNKDLTIERVICGPGHGISIGSLGRYENEKPILGIKVKNCTVENTENGVRIKTWLNSFPSEASEMHFEDIIIRNVTFPIILDQAYCTHGQCEKKTPSKVKLSNISFKNIRGEASSASTMRLVCSSGTPCENIEVADIDLTYTGPQGAPVSECANVKPVGTGKINPPLCGKIIPEIPPNL